MKSYCCEELKGFVKDLDGSSLPIGEGEISGSLSLDKYKGKMELTITDGWNSYQSLIFNFCPYCGIKQ